MSNIILGTAQFGEKYGQSQSNRMSLNLIRKIVSFAAKIRLNLLIQLHFMKRRKIRQI